MTLTPPMIQFDVVIIGGGPAGCAAGLTLLKKEGVSVAIVEADDYSNYRIGESLSPGCRSLLDYLDIWQEFSQTNSLKSFSSNAVWGDDKCQSLDYLFTLHGSGWQIDRRTFDQLLADKFFQRGGEIYQGERINKISKQDGCWHIATKNQTGFLAKKIIDASGRSSPIAKKLGGERIKCDQLVGIASICDYEGVVESAILVEACSYGWWYTAPLPNQKIITVLMADSDTISQLQLSKKEIWDKELHKMPHMLQRLNGATNFTEPKVFPAFSSYLRVPYGENWIAVGDAAASYDPLSSSGIPHALGSGIRGALATLGEIDSSEENKLEKSKLYQKSLRTDFQQYFNTRGEYYSRVARWPDSSFWQRRNTSIELAADQALQYIGMQDQSIKKKSVKEKSTEERGIPKTFLPRARVLELIEQLQEGGAGITAVDAVIKFQQKRPEESEQNIILTLQELLQENFIKKVA